MKRALDANNDDVTGASGPSSKQKQRSSASPPLALSQMTIPRLSLLTPPSSNKASNPLSSETRQQQPIHAQTQPILQQQKQQQQQQPATLKQQQLNDTIKEQLAAMRLQTNALEFHSHALKELLENHTNALQFQSHSLKEICEKQLEAFAKTFQK